MDVQIMQDDLLKKKRTIGESESAFHGMFQSENLSLRRSRIRMTLESILKPLGEYPWFVIRVWSSRYHLKNPQKRVYEPLRRTEG